MLQLNNKIKDNNDEKKENQDYNDLTVNLDN